jgi:hypothetical protein
MCMSVVRGGEFDRWDIHARLGPLAAARLRLTVEEHGHGRQLVRARVWPRPSRGVSVLVAFLVAMYGLAVHRGDALSALVLGCGALVLAARATRECAAAMAAIVDAVPAAVLDVADAPRERHLADVGALRRSPVLTPAVNGGSATSAEALRAELVIGRHGDTR